MAYHAEEIEYQNRPGSWKPEYGTYHKDWQVQGYAPFKEPIGQEYDECTHHRIHDECHHLYREHPHEPPGNDDCDA